MSEHEPNVMVSVRSRQFPAGVIAFYARGPQRIKAEVFVEDLQRETRDLVGMAFLAGPDGRVANAETWCAKCRKVRPTACAFCADAAVEEKDSALESTARLASDRLREIENLKCNVRELEEELAWELNNRRK